MRPRTATVGDEQHEKNKATVDPAPVDALVDSSGASISQQCVAPLVRERGEKLRAEMRTITQAQQRQFLLYLAEMEALIDKSFGLCHAGTEERQTTANFSSSSTSAPFQAQRMDVLKVKFQKINSSRTVSSSAPVDYTVPDAWEILLWVAKLKGKALPPIKRIISSDPFELVITVLIVLNAVVVGVTADLELSSALDVYSGGSAIDGNVTRRPLFFAELILAVAFLIQLLMRMFGLGTRFWTFPD